MSDERLDNAPHQETTRIYRRFANWASAIILSVGLSLALLLLYNHLAPHAREIVVVTWVCATLIGGLFCFFALYLWLISQVVFREIPQGGADDSSEST